MAAVLLARACVGLGEGVALPTMNHLVAAHVPPANRATALGTAFSGFHCGARAGLGCCDPAASCPHLDRDCACQAICWA